MPSQRSRSDSCFSTSSKGSTKKLAKERKRLDKTVWGQRNTDFSDPSKQVLVWDCNGRKKLKMPIGELYDKAGKSHSRPLFWRVLAEHM